MLVALKTGSTQAFVSQSFLSGSNESLSPNEKLNKLQNRERRSCLAERWISQEILSAKQKSKMISDRLLQGCYNVVYLKQYFGCIDESSSGLDVTKP